MVKLSSVAEILNGDRSSNYPSGKDFIAYGIPFINAGHLKNGKIDFSNMDYISKQKYEQLSGAKIQKKDILLCLRGSLGKYAVAEIDAGAPASSIAVIRPNETIIASEFLTCIISSFLFQKQIDLENNGSSQPNLSASSVANFIIPFPPLDEQKRIAEALSNVDSMISSLEKLVEKKKAIKQGAMQELLTGKKRMPGFVGEWKPIQLGSVSKIKTGDKNNEQKTDDGKYPFFVRSQQVERINSYSYDGEAILIPGEGNIGQIFHYINGKFDWHQRVYKISDFSEFVCGKYVYYQMKFSFGKHALKNTVKATVDSLRLPTFEQFEFLIPPIVEEQTAIASILSDMDNEIETLEQKLAKTRLVKQGMMQQLLTGKIRLASALAESKSIEAVSKPHHNHQFDDAVVIAAIVNEFYNDIIPLGRKKVQKLLYLLRRKQEADTSAFKKKAAGPYADEVRYKGGEPIAVRNKYVVKKQGVKGTTFSKGEKIESALEYIEKWEMTDDINWLVSTFKYTKTNDLELFATIDMAICDLINEDEAISVASIKNLIASNKEWKDKLSKTYFSDNDIARAIRFCQSTFN